MKTIHSTNDLWKAYPLFKKKQFANRYLSMEKVKKAFLGLAKNFNLETEGFSVLKKPIRSLCMGNGKTKVLMWSQMHGNETTTTKAVFDLLKFFEKYEKHPFLQELLSRCTIKIIPILNPDGAEAYTRENALGIDLNRDAKALSQPESRVLDKVFKEFKPDFCFNLHDQRSIYSVGNSDKSAIVSFLSPSVDQKQTISANRKISMQLIVGLNNLLQEHIPGHIGRYDDEFNPNCVGDKFQSLNAVTLLFEAGHSPGDYQREETRKIVFFAIMAALELIAKESYSKIGHKEYLKIPENQKLFFDFVLRNVLVKKTTGDVGIKYEERLQNGKIQFVPIVEKIGDLSKYHGHTERTFEKEIIVINNSANIKTDTEINLLTINEKKFGLI